VPHHDLAQAALAEAGTPDRRAKATAKGQRSDARRGGRASAIGVAAKHQRGGSFPRLQQQCGTRSPGRKRRYRRQQFTIVIKRPMVRQPIQPSKHPAAVRQSRRLLSGNTGSFSPLAKAAPGIAICIQRHTAPPAASAVRSHGSSTLLTAKFAQPFVAAPPIAVACPPASDHPQVACFMPLPFRPGSLGFPLTLVGVCIRGSASLRPQAELSVCPSVRRSKRQPDLLRDLYPPRGKAGTSTPARGSHHRVLITSQRVSAQLWYTVRYPRKTPSGEHPAGRSCPPRYDAPRLHI